MNIIGLKIDNTKSVVTKHNITCYIVTFKIWIHIKEQIRS
jgi:hypothetical protein